MNMKQTIITALALLCLTTTAMAKKEKTVTLRLIETSDVHGAFFPYDFIERKPMKGTMARVSTYLKRQREQFGQNLILMDNGDILQGQPTCYYTNFVKTDLPNVAAEVERDDAIHDACDGQNHHNEVDEQCQKSVHHHSLECKFFILHND